MTAERALGSVRAPTSSPRAHSPVVPLVLGAGVAVAVIVLVFALLAGGGAWSPGGLLDAGAVVGWSLPVTRTVTDLAVIAVFGQCLLAVLLPLRRGAPAADARTALRVAAWAAGAAAVLMALTAVLTLASIGGYPLTVAFSPSALQSATQIPSSSYLLISAGLLTGAAVAAAWAARTSHRDAGLLPIAVAAVSLFPVALTGHANTGRGHLVAIVGLGVHLVGVCLWVGGLGALAVYAVRGGRGLSAALPRYSRVAAVCFAAVGLSGVANAATRLLHPAQLVTTSYGALVLAKTACYAVLGAFALGQRRRALPAVAAAHGGQGTATARRIFARLAVTEVLLMAATVGLAVALSRTPTPATPTPTSNVQSELDFSMPPPISLRAVLTHPWFDPVFSTLGIVAVVLYLTGAVRLHRRGDHWPVGRTIAWIGGWSIAVATTCSGLGRYGAITFSAHMTQHMLLSMLAPIPMVLGAPITLALRSLRPAGPGCRGPREWLIAGLNSRAARALAHPLFALALFLVSFYGLYFSSLFATLMSGHAGHVAMNVHFLLTGYLLYWSICGLDHSPTKLPHLARLGLMLAAAPFHAFFGIALANSNTVIARTWYTELGVPWISSLTGDQHLAGNIAWGFGEIPIILVSLALVVQWARSDEQDARRHDRRADRDGEADLNAYNAYLRRLAGPGHQDVEPAGPLPEPDATTP